MECVFKLNVSVRRWSTGCRRCRSSAPQLSALSQHTLSTLPAIKLYANAIQQNIVYRHLGMYRVLLCTSMHAITRRDNLLVQPSRQVKICMKFARARAMNRRSGDIRMAYTRARAEKGGEIERWKQKHAKPNEKSKKRSWNYWLFIAVRNECERVRSIACHNCTNLCGIRPVLTPKCKWAFMVREYEKYVASTRCTNSFVCLLSLVHPNSIWLFTHTRTTDMLYRIQSR